MAESKDPYSLKNDEGLFFLLEDRSPVFRPLRSLLRTLV